MTSTEWRLTLKFWRALQTGGYSALTSAEYDTVKELAQIYHRKLGEGWQVEVTEYRDSVKLMWTKPQ